jgi:hypothetical protein
MNFQKLRKIIINEELRKEIKNLNRINSKSKRSKLAPYLMFVKY